MFARRFESLTDRFFAADHGLLRLRFAARAVVTVGLAVLVQYLLGFPLPVLLLGAIGSMMCSTTLRTGTPWQRGVNILLFAPVMIASLSLSTLLAPHRVFGDIAFVVVMFLAVYVRRFDQLGLSLGMGAFIAYFFATFLKASPQMLPAMYLAICIGAASCAISALLIFRENPQSLLHRATVSVRAQVARLIEELAHVLESGEVPQSDTLPPRIARQTARMHETTLQIEDHAQLIGLSPRWQRYLVDSELAADRLARTIVRALCGELSAETRATLVEDLRGLHRFVDRDPRAALEVDTDALLARIARYDIRGDPSLLPSAPDQHTLLVHRAIREFLLSVVQLRRLTVRTEESAAKERDTEGEPDEADTEQPGPRLMDSTRSAIQAALGGALAIIGGEFLSEQRWYWAVIAGFVVFGGTTSRGDLFVKGWRRVWGTLAGIIIGTVLGTALHGDQIVNLVVLLVCIFLAFYSIRVSYGMMTFFITVMLGMLYDILGTFSGSVLLLRLAETAIGVLAAGIAATIVLPKRTRTTAVAALHDYFEALSGQLRDAERLLVYREHTDLIASTREVDRAAGTARTAILPMTHPMSPARLRRGQATRLSTLVEESALAARNLARAADPGALAGLPAGIRALHRLIANTTALAEATGSRRTVAKLTSGPTLAPTVDVRALAAINNEGVAERLSVLHLRRTVNTIDRLDKVLLGMAPPLEQTVTVPSDQDHRADEHPASRC
ncbi:FUSC family protein [Sciscionella marina]|uniref:FUSC family protein n=1 Tax=Sciscionella marina TaxID=508770 RepID=UPI00036252FC|nr:FUSC family protein [Sciscionella marina]